MPFHEGLPNKLRLFKKYEDFIWGLRLQNHENSRFSLVPQRGSAPLEPQKGIKIISLVWGV
ncbi:MAG: hypothetical protein D6710_09275 [Nitrospirae bacterium]|nr:MAG: hypothetical protein D6710_09275 [Nitrospirota bacterium]